MAYQTYITEALVCGAFDSKTSDRSFLLFTRDAGMVYANARSVREERSKQRYALQIASHIRVTLVRGKTGWKITGAEAIGNFYHDASSREARAFLRNTILLLRRVIHGETPHESVFDDVISACSAHNIPSHVFYERVLALRILHALGYVAPTPAYESLFGSVFPHERVCALTEGEASTYKDVIDHALVQSQL